MKRKINLYYKKIFAVLLLIGIIPVLILMFSVGSMISAQKELLYEVQNSSINNKRKQIEVSLEYVDNSMIRVGLAGPMVRGVRAPRLAENFQQFNEINNQIKLLGSVAFPLSDTILVSSQQNWIMSQNSFLPTEKSEYMDLAGKLSEIDQSSFWYHDASNVYLMERIPVNANPGNGILIARIDKNALRSELNEGNPAGQTVILDEEGRCIVGSQENMAIVEYIKASKQNWQQLLEGRALQTTFHRENYVCAASRSDFNGWTYVSVVLNSDMEQGVKFVYRLMWVVFVSVLFIILTLAYRFSKILYQPIGALNDMVDNTLDSGEMGGPNADATITSKVHYLVEKNAELKRKLSDREAAEVENYLRKLYRGERTVVTEDDLIRHKVTANSIDGLHIHVLAIKYYQSPDQGNDAETCLFGIKNIVSELMGAEDIFAPVVIGQVIYVTHFKEYISAEGAMIRLQKICEMVIMAIAQYMGLRVNIGVSGQVFSVAGLPGAVKECNAALRKAIGKSGVSIFFGVNDQNGGLGISGIHIKQKRLQIIQSVLEGTPDQCMEYINEYFKKLDGVDYYPFKLEVNKLLSDILDCYNEYSLQPDYSKIMEITEFDITKDMDSVEKLKNHLWIYFLRPLNQKVKEPAESQRTVLQIAEYLSSNIEQDISLEQCARHFNYNPNYLSRMFKKQFGKTFTEYMIDKKLERCKELLAQTDISINDISARLGYNSPQNFIRVFKKYTLMTPGQYRNQYKKEESLK